jgi:hypothetical protein
MNNEAHIEGAATPEPRAPLLPKGALGALWWQGLRTLFMMRPQWQGLQATPAVLALLVLITLAWGVLIERLFIPGGAQFYWPSLLSGWLPTVVAVWASWSVSTHEKARGEAPAETPALFGLLIAQVLPARLISVLVLAPLYRADGFIQTEAGRWAGWYVWLGFLLWLNLAQVLALWRGGARTLWPRLFATLVLVAGCALQLWMTPSRHWYPTQEAHGEDEEAFKPLQLSQEDTELQPLLLQQKLQALQPLPRGTAGLYAITFAPYAEEDVFKRESNLVASVMQERFGGQGRTIQLVNHRDTLRQWPWATPINLQRTIRHMARMMKRDDDVLFIHLTSHGASNGELAAEFDPIAVDPVTPESLRRWLDEAGVRWRVISISACYSGSWIPALAGPNTLVMTAADADHTSYGCGRRSELTFFGRAMYDEQLRQHRSFELAHAAARQVIERREQEAGKDDGYSNPQIRMGEAIRGRLQALEKSLAK